jgi:hypothetical protein
MIYQPLTDEKKLFMISWCQEQVEILNGKTEVPVPAGKVTDDNYIFETSDGDVVNAKDLVGHLLATLSNKTITIN